MQDDTIRLVQSLIDSNIGDQAKLKAILNALQVGLPLDVSDEEYVKSISGQLQPTSSTTPELPTQNVTPKPEESNDAVENDTLQGARPARSRKKVAVIASIIAVIVIAYIGLDTYSVGQLQFRPHSGNQYQISPTEIHIEAEVCNPSFFPTTFNKYEISAFYNSDLIEKAEIQGSTVSPKTMSTLEGVFALNADALYKLRQGNFTFDPTLAKITTTVDAPIFGAIPFSVVKQYTAQQFQDVLKNGPPGSFSC